MSLRFNTSKKDDAYTKLEDGGGLTAGNLEKLNQRNRKHDINGSDGDAGSDGASHDLSQEEKGRKKEKGRDDDRSTEVEGFKEFDKYGPLFQDLTTREHIETEHDVVAMAISYDSKAALCIVQNGDEYFELQSWSLTEFTRNFKLEYKGEYLKMNLIEQNNEKEDENKKIFAVAYQDNGRFLVDVIDNTGVVKDSVNLSALLALDRNSLPITGFGEPMITCCFIENDDLFISIYHREEKKQYHLTYSYVHRKLLHDTVIAPMICHKSGETCTTRNFPIKCFYSPVLGSCLTFYR
jgi:hypothetical protein